MEYIKPLYRFLRALLFWPLREFFPRDKRIILLNSYNPYVYCENTKHLFEFLATKKELKPY